MTENTNQLRKVLVDYAVPDPKIVGKLPKGGATLDFVGHADITRILIEIDPHWRLVPIAWENGRPAVNIVNDMATMWFEMTLLGQARLAIGTAKANSMDLDKVLYGDALRNGAMRFGIGLSLWTKQEWDDLDHHAPAKPAPKQTGQAVTSKTIGNRPQDAKSDLSPKPTSPLSGEQIAQFRAACEAKGLDADSVAEAAGIEPGALWIQAHLSALRATFKELVG
jgi:hypothetical protein